MPVKVLIANTNKLGIMFEFELIIVNLSNVGMVVSVLLLYVFC